MKDRATRAVLFKLEGLDHFPDGDAAKQAFKDACNDPGSIDQLQPTVREMLLTAGLLETDGTPGTDRVPDVIRNTVRAGLNANDVHTPSPRVAAFG